jgi:crotonobetainyl-CoA:carnitine CoA-transferase CaiB-like acyl-CoA transferase
MMLAGEANSPPQSVQGGVADQITGIMTGYAVLAGLVARERLGIGQKIETSMLGSVMSLIGLTVGMQLLEGVEAAQQWGDSRHNRKNAYNALWNWYLCKDGKWLMMAMLQHKYWPLVCKALAMEHLENDPRFETPEKRAENCEELIRILNEIFITKSASEWVKVMKERADVVVTPIQNPSDLVNDPQVLANDYITECNHEVLGPVKVLGIPHQFGRTPGVIKPDSPELGQNTEEVLMEIGGYSWDDIAAFKDEEVI